MENTKKSASVPEGRVLTTEEAAEYLPLSVSWLNKLRVFGGGPEFIKLGDKPGSRVGYRMSTVNAWLEARRAANTSQVSRRYAPGVIRDPAGRRRVTASSPKLEKAPPN
jgi:hypothetical protein